MTGTFSVPDPVVPKLIVTFTDCPGLSDGRRPTSAISSGAGGPISRCARERVLGVITGEVGSGKTAAARAAVTALDQTRHTLVYLPDPTTGTRGIHHHVVTALGGRPAHGSAELAAQGASLIAAEHGERGRLPLLVIDEAHLPGHAQLKAIRLLTNSEMDAASPLACLLIGQPTLRRMLRLGVLAALVILSFRVSRSCDLRRPVVDSVADGTLAAHFWLFQTP